MKKTETYSWKVSGRIRAGRQRTEFELQVIARSLIGAAEKATEVLSPGEPATITGVVRETQCYVKDDNPEGGTS